MCGSIDCLPCYILFRISIWTVRINCALYCQHDMVIIGDSGGAVKSGRKADHAAGNKKKD
jgi:hypothetical protein